MNRLLFALAGPIVWFLFFSALYAIETLACVADGGFSAASYRQAGAGAMLASILLIAALAGSQWVSWRRERAFIFGLALLLTGLSLIAILWTALPVFLVESCVG